MRNPDSLFVFLFSLRNPPPNPTQIKIVPSLKVFLLLTVKGTHTLHLGVFVIVYYIVLMYFLLPIQVIRHIH
jgi:hypothetical protein